MFKLKPLFIALVCAASVTLTGCAGLNVTSKQTQSQVQEQVRSTIKEFSKGSDSQALEATNAWAVQETRVGGDFSFTASGPVHVVTDAIAKRAGYELLFAEGIDKNKMTSIGVRDVTPELALRKAAAHAGYAVVIDRRSRSATIVAEATYTFKLPLRMMEQLETSFDVGGNPVASSSPSPSSSAGGAGGGGGAAGGAASQDMGSRIKAQLQSKGRSGNPSKGDFSAFIANLSGGLVTPMVIPEMGLITVRGNGTALMRVYDFLSEYTRDLSLGVRLEVAFVEAEVDGDYQIGVDIKRALSGAGFSLASEGSSLIVNPTLKGSWVSGSREKALSVIAAASKGKVFQNPEVMAFNRSMTQLFSGKNLPYVGSIGTTISQGVSSTSGSLSFATEGLSLAVRVDLVNDREGEILILPVMTTRGELRSFQIGTSQLAGYEQGSTKAFMSVPIQDGAMMVLGGIRYNADNLSNPSLTSVRKINTSRELIIVLLPSIKSFRSADPLYRESI
jgi:hypothetical protein